jgi:hypothetical protein
MGGSQVVEKSQKMRFCIHKKITTVQYTLSANVGFEPENKSTPSFPKMG